MRLDECASIAEQQCEVPVDEMQFALNFLNDAGEIVYLAQHGLLGQVLFLSPGWVVEAIRAIVSHKYEQGTEQLRYQSDVGNNLPDGTLSRSEFISAVNRLQSAVVEWKLLQYAWAYRNKLNRDKKQGFHIEPSSFELLRELLVHFGIGFVRDGNNALLMPCYLPDSPPEGTEELWPTECPEHVHQTSIRVTFPLLLPAGSEPAEPRG